MLLQLDKPSPPTQFYEFFKGEIFALSDSDT